MPNLKKYSNLEATKLVFIYLFSCLFVLSCKQAVKYKEETPIQNESLKDSIPVRNESKTHSFQNIINDSFPLGFVDLKQLDSSVSEDIHYATDSNFTGQSLYPCARCILKEEVAKKLLMVNLVLLKKGYKLKILDCYRPLSIQQKLWDVNPDPHFVMSPTKGSGHSRGTAVDVNLLTLNGKELDMGSSYDEFSQRAFYSYSGIPQEIKRLRWLLKSSMQEQGFNAIRTEWWHFQYGYRKKEAVMDFKWKCK